MVDNDDELPLQVRLEYSGPRPELSDEKELKLYWCTYCSRILKLLWHEIRICQNPACLKQGIADRQERIFELELRIPQMHRELLKEREFVVSEIAKLEKGDVTSLALSQYHSLLKSLDDNLGFYSKNKIVDLILRIESQIRQLAQRIDRPSFSPQFRKDIWLRDNAICYLCNSRIESWEGDIMHIDHIIPRIRGGSDEIHNLKITHSRCNLKKGDSELNERRVKAMYEILRREANDNYWLF